MFSYLILFCISGVFVGVALGYILNAWLYTLAGIFVILGVSFAIISIIQQNIYLEKKRQERELDENYNALIGEEKYLSLAEKEKKNYKAPPKPNISSTDWAKDVKKPVKKGWSLFGGINVETGMPVFGLFITLKDLEANAKEEQRYRRDLKRAERAERRRLMSAPDTTSLKQQYYDSVDKEAALYSADYSKSTRELEKIIKVNCSEIKVKGAYAHISADWSCPTEYHIDGIFRAKLYDKNDNYVGCAYLKLPSHGTWSAFGSFEAECEITQGVPTQAKIEAMYLWQCVKNESSKEIAQPPLDDLVEERSKEHEKEEARAHKKFISSAKKSVALTILGTIAAVGIMFGAIFAGRAIIKSNDEKNMEIARAEATLILDEAANEYMSKYSGDIIEYSILSIEKSRNTYERESYYLVTVRVDLTTTKNAYLYSDIEYDFNLIFNLKNGMEVTTSCSDKKNPYYSESMVYIYVNGGIYKQPSSD